MGSPRLNLGDGTDTLSVQNADGSLGARFDSAGRRRVGTTTAPIVAVGAGAGTGASATIAGTDEHGTVSITEGSSPAAGTLATVTFHQAYATTPIAYVSGQDAHSSALNVTATTTGLVIAAGAAITGNTKINYLVVGGA